MKRIFIRLGIFFFWVVPPYALTKAVTPSECGSYFGESGAQLLIDHGMHKSRMSAEMPAVVDRLSALAKKYPQLIAPQNFEAVFQDTRYRFRNLMEYVIFISGLHEPTLGVSNLDPGEPAHIEQIVQLMELLLTHDCPLNELVALMGQYFYATDVHFSLFLDRIAAIIPTSRILMQEYEEFMQQQTTMSQTEFAARLIRFIEELNQAFNEKFTSIQDEVNGVLGVLYKELAGQMILTQPAFTLLRVNPFFSRVLTWRDQFRRLTALPANSVSAQERSILALIPLTPSYSRETLGEFETFCDTFRRPFQNGNETALAEWERTQIAKLYWLAYALEIPPNLILYLLPHLSDGQSQVDPALLFDRIFRFLNQVTGGLPDYGMKRNGIRGKELEKKIVDLGAEARLFEKIKTTHFGNLLPVWTKLVDFRRPARP